jgi:hypothetical protein
LEIDNKRWRVLQANPVLAYDFLFTKKITLHVQTAASVDVRLLKLDLPASSSELPTTETNCLFHDFTLEINQSDWRQIELFPVSQSDIIEEAVKAVEVILNGQSNPLLGYEQQYMRDNILRLGIAISFHQLCTLLANPSRGNIFFNNNDSCKTDSPFEARVIFTMAP